MPRYARLPAAHCLGVLSFATVQSALKSANADTTSRGVVATAL
jgi:hypothetical protein